jgi:hypothetical protein
MSAGTGHIAATGAAARPRPVPKNCWTSWLNRSWMSSISREGSQRR